MNPQEKPSIKEDLESFFKSRNLVKDNFNKKISLLKKELEEELDKNHENVVASVNFDRIKIFLSEQTRDNLFSGVPYPETGLTLLSIEILYIEEINFIGFEYGGDIIIRFNIKENHHQNNWTEFPLNNLVCDDKNFKITERRLGISFDPHFKEEDYFEVKKVLSELSDKVFNSIPKEAE